MNGSILLISAGVGPIEARRFVRQLADRLERLAGSCGLQIEDVACHAGDEQPRSVAIRVTGDASVLVAELGTHVLIHRSSTRGRAARKRWFAAVSLCPAPEEAAALERIPRSSVIVTACRAGGPGGQHVNKVSSAVRVEHVASGLSVRSSRSRSQHTNLDHALRRLSGLLHEQATIRRAAGRSAQRQLHYRVERGRPVRTYVLDAAGALVERSAP